MIEILPAVLIFVMVLTAILQYFTVFRGAVENEQVVRNLMLAKIANSGTLTTPAGQLSNSSQTQPRDTSTPGLQMDVEGRRGIVVPTNVFVDHKNPCFSVFPPEWKQNLPTSGIFAMGAQKGFPSIQLVTYAVIYRTMSNNARCPF